MLFQLQITHFYKNINCGVLLIFITLNWMWQIFNLSLIEFMEHLMPSIDNKVVIFGYLNVTRRELLIAGPVMLSIWERVACGYLTCVPTWYYYSIIIIPY